MSWIDGGGDYCNRIRNYLDSQESGELSAETNPEVFRHLEECSACARVFKTRMRVRARLKEAVLRQDVPGSLEPGIRRALRTPSRDGYRWTLAAAAVIAVASGILGAVWLSNRAAARQAPGPAASLESASEAAASILQIGLGDHVHCALDAGFANKQFTDDTMSQNLGPEFAGLISLVRERVPPNLRVVVAHRCKYNGRQFEHLILRDEQTVMSLVITRKNGESFPPGNRRPALPLAGVPLHEASLQNMEVSGFESEHYLAFVVSNLSRDDNLRIASGLAVAVRDFLS